VSCLCSSRWIEGARWRLQDGCGLSEVMLNGAGLYARHVYRYEICLTLRDALSLNSGICRCLVQSWHCVLDGSCREQRCFTQHSDCRKFASLVLRLIPNMPTIIISIFNNINISSASLLSTLNIVILQFTVKIPVHLSDLLHSSLLSICLH
jgi:hypothetical protein